MDALRCRRRYRNLSRLSHRRIPPGRGFTALPLPPPIAACSSPLSARRLRQLDEARGRFGLQQPQPLQCRVQTDL